MTLAIHRRLATVTLTAALAVATSLSVGACTSTASSSPGGTTPTTSAPSGAASGAAGTEATAQICADLATQSSAVLQPLLPLLTGATDAATLQTDVDQIKTAVTGWTAELRADAAKAQDPAVATGLTNAATGIDAAVSSNLGSSSLTAPALQATFTSIAAALAGMVGSCPDLASLANLVK